MTETNRSARTLGVGLVEGPPSGELTAGLDVVLEQALRCLGCDATGVVVAPEDGPARVLAASEAEVRQLDQLQLGWHQGATVDALADGGTHLSGDLGCDQRWRRWGSAAAGLGWRAVLATPLIIPGTQQAALTLYARAVGGFDATYGYAARTFALHATTVLSRAVTTATLRTASPTRRAAGLASGL